ncbi:PTS lactose/cellobiose transporter subunit IIA [Lacticaseibacillus pantheris]|uniref:PTS lactose/cellobiose transporter subunit IIA n=1 Tax=Lacticaseibacillus pantheris TaxID=171523 RepID=UPI0009E9D81A|nr:PTS lactose/cellobiose transporter subunit IIA [Lacticaseibacillus pantheris]
MATKEEISMTGFAIVAYAGDAKTALLHALDNARKGEFDKARELVKQSEESINDAHNEQTQLLSKEAGGENMDVTFIMVHGQDTLMTTMLLKDEVNFFIDEYERIAKVEKKIRARRKCLIHLSKPRRFGYELDC